MDVRGARLAAAWVDFSSRHSGAVLAIALLVSIAGAVGTADLYSHLRADMSELLPLESRSARDAATITRRVAGWAEETVALHGADAGALREFADDLAPRIRAIPELVDVVEYRIDEEQRFFDTRRWLFPALGDLVALRDGMKARLAWGPHRADPAWLPDDDDPGMQVEDVLERIRAEHRDLGLLARFPDGYFLREIAGPDGVRTPALVLRVRLAGDPEDYDRVESLDREVRRAVEDSLRAHPGVRVDFGGYVAAAIFEHRGLAEDLALATALVMVAVALSIALYYRTAKSIAAVGGPLLCGVMATFGLADLLVGHLNSNTAFLGSIVIGNGINVGLILFARYVEERRRGEPALAAMNVAVVSTWLATLTAALAAAIAYGSLGATRFRGFTQFGLIGGVGMAACWIATYAVMPALVLAWERRRVLIAPDPRPRRALVMNALAGLVERAPGLVRAGCVAAGIAALLFAVRFARDPLEYDFGRLRDSRALQNGGPAFWEDAVFGGHLDPAIVLAAGDAEARAIAAAFAARKTADPVSSLGAIFSIADVVPGDQDAKLEVLRSLRALATPEALKLATPGEQMLITANLPPADLQTFTAGDLPPLLRARLTERDGTIGTPVLVYPAADVSVWNGHDALRVAREIRTVPLPRDDVPVTSSLLVFADVLAAILRDGPRATLLSFAGVSALVLAMFGVKSREGRGDAARVLLALCAGALLFVGLAGALSLKLNMLSFIALPITFGIGVDYATNIVQRCRVTGDGFGECLRTTGGAVALCSATTILGYSSLLVAHNQALRSFGILADLGEIACLAAAFLVVPSLGRRDNNIS